MTASPYNENQLVEQPAIGLFAELGWAIACGTPHPGPLPAGEGTGADDAGLFGRETTGEVVLISRLRAALAQLNPERLRAEGQMSEHLNQIRQSRLADVHEYGHVHGCVNIVRWERVQPEQIARPC